MSTNQSTKKPVAPGPYRYYRDRDGVNDILFIEDSRDCEILMGIYFWDEPDTDEAAQAEAKAEMIVKALNMPGCWIDQYHVTRFTLLAHKQIAAIWSVLDVQRVRPDLSEAEAWEVLQWIDRYQDGEHGITWDTLRLTADEKFPKKPRTRKAKRAV